MLEQSALLLRPWAAGADGVRSRAVFDPTANTPLGLARTRSDSARLWPRWLNRPALEVYETEDESLLCTVQRSWGWGPRWSVREADEQLVGSVRGPQVLDRLGRTLAVLHCGRFVDSAGIELGRLERCGEGLRLSFAVWLEGDPFARMLLLAAALTSDW
jgi:hypothetical protein